MYAEMNKQFVPLAPVGSTEGPQGQQSGPLVSLSLGTRHPLCPLHRGTGVCPGVAEFPSLSRPAEALRPAGWSPSAALPVATGDAHPSVTRRPPTPAFTHLAASGTVWLITCHISPRLVPRKGCVADGRGSQIFSKRGGGRPAAPKGAPRPLARQGGLTCPAGVPRQGDARGGRRGDDDVGNIQVLVAQDGGLVVAAAADTHF